MKGSLLDRRPEQRSSRDTRGGMRLPVGIQPSIIQTLKYSDHFHFPLTAAELHLRLVSHKTTQKNLLSTLAILTKHGVIERHGDYYCLPGTSSNINQRQLYARLSKPLLQYANSLIPVLTVLRPIKAIYLTGSLALNNTDGHDDIDLMIIVEDGRLWTTRALLTLYTTLLRLRRTPHARNPMGMLCLNLYLTPKAYSLPPIKRSLYTAYELIQAVPLYDPYHTHAALLDANSWIYEHLPNLKGTVPKRNPRQQVEEGSSADEGTVPKVTRFIESLAYRLQLAYMRSKITLEYITPDSAFFHPNNPAPKV